MTDTCTPQPASIHDLADAVRTINDPDGFKRMVRTIGSLPLTDHLCQVLLTTFLANVPHRRDFDKVHQHNLASALVRTLMSIPYLVIDDDQERAFIAHAIS